MKKYIFMFSATLTILSLVVFNIFDWNSSQTSQTKAYTINDLNSKAEFVGVLNNKEALDFFYRVDTRYAPVKKSNLNTASSIRDFLTEEEMPPAETYQSISIIVVKDNKRTTIEAISDNDKLSKPQADLFKYADYTTNFLVKANYNDMSEEAAQEKYGYWSPHLTIVPEQQAIYKDGINTLMSYFKAGINDILPIVDVDKLKSTNIYFTVTKTGSITNIRIEEGTSNYLPIDEKLIELLSNTSGAWEPAKNSKDQKVDQELVFSFGIKGC